MSNRQMRRASTVRSAVRPSVPLRILGSCRSSVLTVHALAVPSLARFIAPRSGRELSRTIVATEFTRGLPGLAMRPLAIVRLMLPVYPMGAVGTRLHMAGPIVHPRPAVVDDRAAGVVPAVHAAVIRTIAVIIRAIAIIVRAIAIVPVIGVADAARESYGDQAGHGRHKQGSHGHADTSKRLP